MMKKFSVLFMQDITLAFRNVFMWIMLASLIVMILVVNFLIPERINPPEKNYIFDKSKNKILEKALESKENTIILENEEAVEKHVEKDKNGVGIIFNITEKGPEFTLVYRGGINEKNLNVVEAVMRTFAAKLQGKSLEKGYELQLLGEKIEPLADNMKFIPILISFEVLVLGFFVVASFIFDEKQEGSIKALRITPAGVDHYIISKAALFCAVSLVYGAIFVVSTVGFSINWLTFTGAILLGSAFYTLLGIIVAVFFKNISEWIFAGLAVLIINMIPVFYYMSTLPSSALITWIPSYSVLFGFEDILFGTRNSLAGMFYFLLATTIIAYIVCRILVKIKIMKEAR